MRFGSTVLDAYAILALFRAEASAPVVERHLARAVDAGEFLPMCTVNWGEVVYRIAQESDEHTPEAVSLMDALPIALVDADRELTVRAATLKGMYRLGYADSFAAALAMILDAPLLTGDPDFLALQDAGLKLEYLGEA